MLRCPIAIPVPLVIILSAVVLVLHHVCQLRHLLPVLLRKLLLVWQELWRVLGTARIRLIRRLHLVRLREAS